MKIQHLLATVLVTACALPAFAQSHGGAGLGQTMRNQEQRIAQGVQSGELTRREARELQQQQYRIRADLQAARQDGTVSGAERREIMREQERASRAIQRMRSNGRNA